MRQSQNIPLRKLAVALAASTLASPALALQRRAEDRPAENPDLTGKVPVKGFRLDKKFPGNWESESEQGGWSLQLNITKASPSATFFAVKLLPPGAGEEGALVADDGKWLVGEDASNSWALTALGFNIMEFPMVPGGNDMEDGSCSESAFSEQCRKDFTALIKQDLNKLHLDLEAPASCHQYKMVSGEGIRTDNLENFTKDSRFGWSYDTPGATLTAWDEFRNRTWPFIFVWAPTGSEELTDDHIQFSCVKVDKNAKTGESLITGNATTTSPGPSSTAPTNTPSTAPLPAGASRTGTVGLFSAVGAAILGLGMAML